MILENLIHKAMGDCDFRIKELRLKIVSLSNEISEITTERNNLLIELQRICTHEKVKKVSQGYISGGYDHVSQETYTLNCTNCDKVLQSKTIRGSYA